MRNQSPTEVRTAAPVCPCACQQCTMGPVLSVSCPAHCPAHCPTRLRQETATSCLCCFCCAQRGHVCTSLKGCASPPPPQTSPHPLSLEVFPRLKLPVDELSDRQRFKPRLCGQGTKKRELRRFFSFFFPAFADLCGLCTVKVRVSRRPDVSGLQAEDGV